MNALGPRGATREVGHGGRFPGRVDQANVERPQAQAFDRRRDTIGRVDFSRTDFERRIVGSGQQLVQGGWLLTTKQNARDR